MPLDYSNITVLGNALYTEYLYPFEIAGVILTVAIIAAIGLSARGPRQRKVQDVSAQIATKKSDRLTVLKGVK
jgi:NADH-quinone oxidoreductase subunit J